MTELSEVSATIGKACGIFSKAAETASNASGKVAPTLAAALKVYGEAICDAIQELDRKIIELGKTSLATNSTLDNFNQSSAASDVQQVCDLAVKQQSTVKLSNLELGDQPLSGNLEAKSKVILEAIPTDGIPGGLKATKIRQLGKPREGRTTAIVELSDINAKNDLFKRVKNSNKPVRVSNWLPGYLHNVVTKLNKAYRALPSMEGQWIKVNLNPDRKLIFVLKKSPDATEWTLVETLKVPIPQCYVSENIPQNCKSKLLDARTIAELVPKTLDN